MNEERILELYTRFRGLRRRLSEASKLAEHVQIPLAEVLFDRREDFARTAQQDLLDLANFVNEFILNVNALSAWASLSSSLGEDELGSVTIEFIHPAAYFCLGVPYALKGRLHSSIARVSHLANEFTVPGWRHIPDLGPSSVGKAKQHASGWQSWAPLGERLEQLDDPPFRKAVACFRNEYNHGSPRGVVVGEKAFVERSDGITIYGATRPLGLENLVAALLPQQRAAVAAHEAYRALVREQFDAVVASELIARTPRTYGR